MEQKMYKFLNSMNYTHLTHFDYSKFIPGGEFEGQWLPDVEKPLMCIRGYHASTLTGIREWAYHFMYEVELDGMILRSESKWVATRMRFIRRIETWDVAHVRKIILRFARFMAERCKGETRRKLLEIIDKIPDSGVVENKPKLWETVDQISKYADIKSAAWICRMMLVYLTGCRESDFVSDFCMATKELWCYGKAHDGGRFFFDKVKDFYTKTMLEILELEE